MNAPRYPERIARVASHCSTLTDVIARKFCVPPGAQLVVFSTSAGLAPNFCVPDLGSRFERISKTNG